eukprot:gb/GECG01016218.1/.p1 GENE.gb/GECG01016218.1/~~gb/GECG01016218.1/.p1  ORF type:complete len:267 (+),score=29.08 gb/GECG01016218.1/:1-801(+)
MAEENKTPETIASLIERYASEHGELPPSSADPNTAWKQLQTGNELFSKGDIGQFSLHLAKQITLERRSVLGTGQSPIATVLTCADSRVSPELVFGCGLGELFVVRNAGNVLGHDSIASIEFGIKQLKCPLLLVMGHQQCGAVSACVEYAQNHQCNILVPGREAKAAATVGEAQCNSDLSPMNTLMEKILPAVVQAYHELPQGREQTSSTDKLIEDSVDNNVRNVVKQLMCSSETIRDAVREHQTAIMGCKYRFMDGKVETLCTDAV